MDKRFGVHVPTESEWNKVFDMTGHKFYKAWDTYNTESVIDLRDGSYWDVHWFKYCGYTCI